MNLGFRRGYLVALTLAFSTWAVCLPSSWAQSLRTAASTEPSASHRRLPLPPNGGQDLMQQFRMLQHLQELVSLENPTPSQQSPGSNSELLERLREMLSPQEQKMLEAAQQQFNQMDGVDSEALTKIAEEFRGTMPEREPSRSDVEKLLRDFLQSRQLPPALPPLPNGNSNAVPLPSHDVPSTGQSKSMSTEASTPSSSAERERDAALGDFRRKSSQSPDGPQSGRDSSTMSGTSQALAATAGNGPSSLESSVQRPNDLSSTPRATPSDQAASPLDRKQIPTVPELLKKSKDNPESVPPLKIPENSLNMDEIRRLLAERFPKQDRDDWLDSIKRNLPNSLKAELSQTGLKESLTDIMDEMKQGNRANKDSGQSAQPLELTGLGASPGSASLGSIQAELERLSQGTQASESGNNSSQSSSSQSSNAAAGKDAGNKSKPGLFGSVHGIYNKWMSSSEPGSSSADAPSASPNSESSQSAFGVRMLVALGTCLSLLVAWYRYMPAKGSRTDTLKLRDVAALSLTTRADLVRAFHWMAGEFAAAPESWWTHRRAVSELSRVKPDAKRDLEILSELYEIARYSPAERQLTSEQYQQARRALEQIATC